MGDRSWMDKPYGKDKNIRRMPSDSISFGALIVLAIVSYFIFIAIAAGWHG